MSDQKKLARSLDSLSKCLSDVAEMDGALEASKEAALLYIGLYEQCPDDFRTDTADALEVFRICLQSVGRTEEAQAAGEWALQI